MARYVVTRLVALVGIVFAISIGCFALVHLLPGDPTVAILGTSDTPHNRAIVMRQLGLDRNIASQYLTWISNVLHGNLGYSFAKGQSVSSIIAQSYRYDLFIIVLSQVIAYIVAIPLAVYSARRAGGVLDQGATSVTFAFYCLPSFILILWFVQLFAVKWHLFPGPGAPVFPTGESFVSEFRTNLRVFLLPSAVIALGTIALYYRLLRGEMLATLQEEFITVARSKGLSSRRILWHHALRPSSVTLLTSTGNNIALLLTGLFVVEYKLALPGIGYQLVVATGQSDYLTVQGIALVVAVTVVVVNFAIDIITTLVDPRIARA
jgi:peptide/nickel transport system permease protein